MRDGKLQRLKALPVFAECDDIGLKRIGQYCDLLNVAPGTPLSAGEVFIALVEGVAEVDDDGTWYGPGDSWGIAECLTGWRHPRHLRAATSARVVVVTERALRDLARTVPGVGLGLATTLAIQKRAND